MHSLASGFLKDKPNLTDESAPAVLYSLPANFCLELQSRLHEPRSPRYWKLVMSVLTVTLFPVLKNIWENKVLR